MSTSPSTHAAMNASAVSSSSVCAAMYSPRRCSQSANGRLAEAEVGWIAVDVHHREIVGIVRLHPLAERLNHLLDHVLDVVPLRPCPDDLSVANGDDPGLTGVGAEPELVGTEGVGVERTANLDAFGRTPDLDAGLERVLRRAALRPATATVGSPAASVRNRPTPAPPTKSSAR